MSGLRNLRARVRATDGLKCPTVKLGVILEEWDLVACVNRVGEGLGNCKHEGKPVEMHTYKLLVGTEDPEKQLQKRGVFWSEI